MDICGNRNKNPILDQGQVSSNESGGGTFIEHSLDFVCTTCTTTPCSCRDHDKNLTKSFEDKDKPWGWLVPSQPVILKTPVR